MAALQTLPPTFTVAKQADAKAALLASPFTGSLSRSSLRASLSSSSHSQRAATCQRRALSARAEGDAAGEVFELEIERPYGIKFYRGADGGIYVDALTPGYPAAKTGRIAEGDKLLATSAVFGDEMWPAAEYGRTMYCIQQRVGPMIMRFEKRMGEKIGWFKQEKYLEERAAGNYGDAIRDKQLENWQKRLELQEKREETLSQGLSLYKEGQYQKALETFQTVLGMGPEYKEQGVAFYNMACCCSKLQQLKAGLDALEAAMKSGFEDYKKIREDSDLAFLRNSDEFDELLSKYDEPFINENAIKALTSLFGFGRK